MNYDDDESPGIVMFLDDTGRLHIEWDIGQEDT